MAKMGMVPGMIYVVEELTLQRAREHGSIAIASFEEIPKWGRLLTGEHAAHAAERMAAFEKCANAIGDAFHKLDEELAIAQTKEEGRDRERAAAEKRRADDRLVDLGLISHRMRLENDSRSRGSDGKVIMCCPSCESGEWVNDRGVCATCGVYAFDVTDKDNVGGAVRKATEIATVGKPRVDDNERETAEAPAPAADAPPIVGETPPPEAGPNAVRVLKVRANHKYTPPPGIAVCGKPLDCGGTCCRSVDHDPSEGCLCIGDDPGAPGTCPA